MLILLSLNAFLYYGQYGVIAQNSSESSKIQEANRAIQSAFNAVLDAEKVGANVTVLLNQLNDATALLAQAENAYNLGDYTTALNDATAVLPTCSEVSTLATNLQVTTTNTNRETLWSLLIFIAIGIIVFVLVLFLVWHLFKRHYLGQLLQAKPEVVKQ